MDSDQMIEILVNQIDSQNQIIRQQLAIIEKLSKSGGQIFEAPVPSENGTTTELTIPSVMDTFNDLPEVDDPMDVHLDPSWNPYWTPGDVNDENERRMIEAQQAADVEAAIATPEPNMMGDKGLG